MSKITKKEVAKKVLYSAGEGLEEVLTQLADRFGVEVTDGIAEYCVGQDGRYSLEEMVAWAEAHRDCEDALDDDDE